MSICGSYVQTIVLRSACLDNDSHFPDEAFSMAIHDAGMFTVNAFISTIKGAIFSHQPGGKLWHFKF